MYNPFDFSGKKFILTGGTSGIGKATAIQLAQQGAGVFFLGRNEKKMWETISSLPGTGHDYAPVDFQEKADLKPAFDRAVSDGKAIDGIVHCAAIADVQPLAAISEEKVFNSMRVNLVSFIEMVKLYSKRKYHAENGSIVGISSTSALYPEKGNAIYAATKASMNAVLQSFAKELTAKGIRINAVLPACVDTPMLRNSDQASDLVSSEDSSIKRTRQLLGISQPEDIASVILFLLSDASRVITGRTIFADGGDINFNV